MGWTPQTLTSVTAKNVAGVRNPYAVLTARLSPAELPGRRQGRRGRRGAVSANRSPGCSITWRRSASMPPVQAPRSGPPIPGIDGKAVESACERLRTGMGENNT